MLSKENKKLYKDYKKLKASGVTGIYDFLQKKYPKSKQRITAVINNAKRMEKQDLTEYQAERKKHLAKLDKKWDKVWAKKYEAVQGKRIAGKNLITFLEVIEDMTIAGASQLYIAKKTSKAVGVICYHVGNIDFTKYLK